MATALSETQALSDALQHSPGTHVLVLDDSDITFLTHDVYRSGERPSAVVRPATVDDLVACVQTAVRTGSPIVVRGGGASYTDGYLATRPGTLLVDTSALKHINVDETNNLVTVEAGVTWAELKEALDPLGLRTPFFGPFSGLAATVAGSVSQHAISHGTGAYGASAGSVVSLDVVTGHGELISTGSAATGGKPFFRHFGPDLTGLFTGDCGTLGVKARVTLPLQRRFEHFEALSFAFPHFAALHAAMRIASLHGLDDEHFAVDAALSQGQLAREERAGRKTEVAVSVIKNASSLAGGLKQLAKMGIAGDRALKEAEYLCHFIIDGSDPAETKARARLLRELLAELGSEAPNTVPAVVRGLPFAPLYNVLGPHGERWAPLHGFLPHDDVLKFHVAYDELLERFQADFDRLKIWVGAMFEAVGPNSFLYEVAIYWPDAQSPYHQRVVDADYLANLPTYDDNPEARDVVERFRQDLIALYRSHGATHFQLGKAYPYFEQLQPPAQALVQALKSALDPQGLMNPGALGLPPTAG
ncbi:MAG: FAD-binding oxidoreductase [Pseudomonadota bacterium]